MNMTTANMTTPQGCSPEMPYRWVGTKQSPSKPHYLYHEDKVVLYTSDISPEYAGKVAASLNSHQALVVALGDLLHFCELAHHDSAILTAARALWRWPLERTSDALPPPLFALPLPLLAPEPLLRRTPAGTFRHGLHGSLHQITLSLPTGVPLATWRYPQGRILPAGHGLPQLLLQ